MTNKEFSILKSDIYKNARLKECFLDNCDNKCSANIINAHSLQRMGSLSILESEVNKNNSLYTITEHQISEANNLLELNPIGKHKASTFYGFCGYHDASIFKSIEENPNIIDIHSDEHCFLLSFRAFAISYHRKKEDVNLYSTNDKNLKEKIKKYRGTDSIVGLLNGAKMGLNDLQPNKDFLIKALSEKDYSCLEYFAYELDYTVPIAACMLTSPPFLFSGKSINISTDPDYKYSDIITSVIPLNSKTIVVMAAFCDSPYGAKYLDELSEMPELKLQKALTWHVLTDMENFFISPKWFDTLNVNLKHNIIMHSLIAADVNQPYLTYSHKFPYNFFIKKCSI